MIETRHVSKLEKSASTRHSSSILSFALSPEHHCNKPPYNPHNPSHQCHHSLSLPIRSQLTSVLRMHVQTDRLPWCIAHRVFFCSCCCWVCIVQMLSDAFCCCYRLIVEIKDNGGKHKRLSSIKLEKHNRGIILLQQDSLNNTLGSDKVIIRPNSLSIDIGVQIVRPKIIIVSNSITR